MNLVTTYDLIPSFYSIFGVRECGVWCLVNGMNLKIQSGIEGIEFLYVESFWVMLLY